MTESATTPTFHTTPGAATPSFKAKLLRPMVLVPAAAILALGAIGATVAVGTSQQQAAAQASASQSALAQSVFIQQWRQTLPNTGAQDSDIIATGKGVCDAYHAGTTFFGEVQYLMSVSNGNVSASDAGALIGLSTNTFCPEFNNRH